MRGITVLFGFVIMFLKQGGPQRYRGPFMPVWILSLFTVAYLVYLVLPVVKAVEKTKEALPADYGTIQFIRFLVKYPKIAEEASDGKT